METGEYATFSDFSPDFAPESPAGADSPAAAASVPPSGAAESNPHLQRALAELSALDPDIRTLDDLDTMPGAEKFHRLVLRGNSLPDAYRLARFDTLVDRQVRGARDEAVRSWSGRSHLAAYAPAPSALSQIPAETLEMYRQINPGLRDEDYRAHYARTRGRG